MVTWCPDWPVVVAEQPMTTPVAVLAKGQVLACSPAARVEGVRRGMRRRDAQSRCPELVLVDHQPDAEARAFEKVLSAIEELTPGVAPLRPGLCALRVPPRYYGGERESAAVLAEHLVGLGVWDVRAGIADGLFAAEQAARRALMQDVCIIAPGGSRAFLADLPIETVDDSELTDLLRRLGIRTLGQFAALQPADVRTRFGDHGALLHRYARGEDPNLIARRAVPPELQASIAFEPPLSRAEQVAFSVRMTAERFISQLADHGLVATSVRVDLEANGEVRSSRTWRHPRWFSSADLVDRVRWQLQGMGAPGGGPLGAPLDLVRLVPEVAESLGDHADALFGNGGEEALERAVARVQSLVGHEGVLSAGVQGGRSPADRQLLKPWGERSRRVRPLAEPWPGRMPEPAPAVVFRIPPQALVIGEEGRPVAVDARGAITCRPSKFRPSPQTNWLPVASWAGPWPVDEHWWDEANAKRVARFQIVGVDGSAWLLSVTDGHWVTEAKYD
jgi:protein ImuB